MANLSCIPKFVKKEFLDILVAETWKLMLLNSNHAPNAGTQQYVSDVVINQITDVNSVYTAGGVAVAGKVAVASGNDYYLDLTDTVIGPGSTIIFRYGVLFKDTGSQATSRIRAQVDFLTDQITTNGTRTIKWNALGIIKIT